MQYSEIGSINRKHFRVHSNKSIRRDILLSTVRIDRLIKDAEPHYGRSPLANLDHPGNIPNDRFSLMPDWANIHQYYTMRLKSGIMV